MVLDGNAHALIGDDGAVTRLTRSEYAVMNILACRGDVVTYRSVRASVSSDGDLTVLLSRLRAKIRRAGLPETVGTRWGVGLYLLVPLETANPEEPVVLPGRMRKALADLLYSHPNRAAADRIIAAMG